MLPFFSALSIFAVSSDLRAALNASFNAATVMPRFDATVFVRLVAIANARSSSTRVFSSAASSSSRSSNSTSESM
jgi:hypothetical protein